jgi:hypothetical protein
MMPKSGKSAMETVMHIRFLSVAVLSATLGLGGCGQMSAPQDSSSSGLATQTLPDARAQGPVARFSRVARYDVGSITVNVPRSLTVSEANLYHPNTDIVWRGEPLGDRYAQIEAILTEAMAKGTEQMDSGPKVDIEVTLLRFHCVTEKTRYSFGGMHSMNFELTVREAATGAVLDGPRVVVANAKASGGQKAMDEELSGLTQRVVVVDRLAEAIKTELSIIEALPEADARLAAVDTTVMGLQDQ